MDQIDSIEALRLLPERTVILDRGHCAYQREGDDWGADGRWYEPGQIPLPVTVLWLPYTVLPHEHRWISVRQITDATYTERCNCGATRTEDVL